MKRLHTFATIGVLSLFLVPAVFVFASDIDSGLRIKDSTGIVNIAGSMVSASSTLHLKTSVGVESILLVQPTDPLASKARIKTSTGVMAFKKYMATTTQPTNLATSSVACGGNITLIWGAPTTGYVTGYNIVRKNNVTLVSTTFTIIGSTTLTFVDTQANGLVQSTSYTYTVAASNDAGNSNTATIITTSSGSCVPNIPANFSASQGANCGGNISLSWSEVTGADYKIYRSTASAGTYLLVATPVSGVTSYTDTASTSVPYYYKIVATKGGVDSSMSPVTSATASGICAPANFGIQSVGSCGTGQVTLSWVPQTDAVAYKITRTNNTTSITVIASITGPTAFTYIDTGLTANISYTYYAVSSNGRGGYATSTPAVTDSPNNCVPATAPATFTATTGACGTNNVVLAWSAVTGATAYRVYTDYGSGFYTQIATTTSLTYTFTGGNYVTAYSYKVLGYNDGGDSALFASASAPGPMMCLTSMNFWAVPYDYIGSSGGTFENMSILHWSSTGASSCTGNGNGLNLFGTWGSGGAGDPSYSTSGTKNTAYLTPTAVYGTPLTTSSMFSMACMNGNGVFGDNTSLVVTPTSYGEPTGVITFVPTRDASGNPVVNYTTGKVQGWIKYGCNYSSPLSTFSVSSDGGSTWTPITSGAGVATYNTSTGALTGQYSTGQSNTLGYFGGKQYRLDCHGSITNLGVTTDYGDAFIYIAPRADTASDNWQSLAWFPWITPGQANLQPPIPVLTVTNSMPFPNKTINYSCVNGSGSLIASGNVIGNAPGTYGPGLFGGTAFTLTCSNAAGSTSATVTP